MNKYTFFITTAEPFGFVESREFEMDINAIDINHAKRLLRLKMWSILAQARMHDIIKYTYVLKNTENETK